MAQSAGLRHYLVCIVTPGNAQKQMSKAFPYKGCVTMHADLNRILQDLKSGDLETRNQAVGQAGLLLEKRSISNPDNSIYEGLLPTTLLSITLDTEEQRLFIHQLCDAIYSDNMTEGMLWALGKADKDLGLEPLLRVIRDQGQKLNDEANWQALVALDNFLTRSGTREELQKQRTLMDEYGIEEWLHQFTTSSEPRLQKMAHWLLEEMQDINHNRYVE